MPDFKALSETPQGWGIIAGILFMILMTNACHEGGHALMAWWRGDRRESIRARCTLNPISHFHWFLTLVLPVLSMWLFGFVIGGARPVYVDTSRIDGARGLALVGLAGPLGNFLFTGFAIALMGLLQHLGAIDPVDQIASVWWKILAPAIFFSTLFGLLNLLPFPPLDGSRIVALLLPEGARRVWYSLAPLGLIATVVFWLWISGGLWHFGVTALGPGHPELVFHEMPSLLEDYATEMGDFIGDLL